MEFAASDVLKLGERRGGALVPGGPAKMTAWDNTKPRVELKMHNSGCLADTWELRELGMSVSRIIHSHSIF
jgi:hypothetical protein